MSKRKKPDFWNVVFGNYYPSEVMNTFRTKEQAEGWSSEHQQENNYMLKVEAGFFSEDSP